MGLMDYILLAALGAWLIYCLRAVFVKKKYHCGGDCQNCKARCREANRADV